MISSASKAQGMVGLLFAYLESPVRVTAQLQPPR
jgi:hypothetical protein